MIKYIKLCHDCHAYYEATLSFSRKRRTCPYCARARLENERFTHDFLSSRPSPPKPKEARP